jgi:beta-lactamase superfamily II metal-dependent hydrolase
MWGRAGGKFGFSGLARGVRNKRGARADHWDVKVAGLPLLLELAVPGLLLVGCGAAEACGSGTWRRGDLEIHHLAIGQADATLVVSPTGRTLMVDLGEETPLSSRGAQRVAATLEGTLGCRRLDYVLITHFHLDHVGQPGVGGLWHLAEVQGFAVGTTFHRDLLGLPGERGPLQLGWQRYLEGSARWSLRPARVARGDQQIDLGPEVQVRIVALDGQGTLRPGGEGQAGAPNENDFSVALHLRFGSLDYFLGGDLSGALAPAGASSSYHDVETTVARELPDLDVYRVSHHGSDHSSNPTFLAQTDPEVAIVSVGDGNRHHHPHPAALERLAATGAVYLTQRGDPASGLAGARVAGDVVLRSGDGRRYTVDGDPFRAADPPRIDGDGDGYFIEADPDDTDAARLPAPRGGCDPVFQSCAAGDW